MKRCGLSGTLFSLSLQQCDSNDLNFAAQGFCRPPWIRLVSQSRLLQDMKRSQSQPNSKRTWNGIGHPAKACFVKESGNSRWHLRLDEKGCQLEEQRHHPTLFFWNEAARGTPQVSWNCSAQPWNSPEIFRNPEILVFWASRNRRFPCRKRTLLDLGHNVNIRALSGRWTDSAETSELPSPTLCHVIRCCYPMLSSHVISCCYPMLSHVPFLILLSRQSMLVIWTQNARARRAQGRLSGDFPFALGDDFGSGHVNLFCAAGRLSGPRSTNLADRDSQYTRMYIQSFLLASSYVPSVKPGKV